MWEKGDANMELEKREEGPCEDGLEWEHISMN